MSYHSKAKAVEEPPPAGSEALTTGAWHEAGSRVSVSLSMLRPLVASWKLPPKQAVPLSALVPPRPDLSRYVPAEDAMQVSERDIG